MAKLRIEFERALAARMADAQFKRQAAGLYVSAIDGVVWKGLAISLLARRGGLSVSPALGIYCPNAYRIMRMAFRRMGNHAFENGAISQRMGIPFSIAPLHGLLNKSSLSYDVTEQMNIGISVADIYRDFCAIQVQYFAESNNIDELIRTIFESQSGRHPGAAINAIALSVAKNGKISDRRLRTYVELYPSSVTARFAEAVKDMLRSKISAE
jgi:hypothetical protein